MTTSQMTQLKPGIVADRNGEHYWFSGSALVPTRYDKNPVWGSGFTHDSQLFTHASPFTQVSVLSDVPQRKTPTLLHSSVKKNAKRRNKKVAFSTPATALKTITAKPLVTAILVSVALTVVLNLVTAGFGKMF